MLGRASLFRCLRPRVDGKRWFFYDIDSIKEEYEERRGVREYLRDDSLKTRFEKHFKNENATLDNIFITEISAYFKAVSSKEDIDIATKILSASFRDSHYHDAAKYSSEIINRYFVLCLSNNLPNEATEAWKLLEESGRNKGKNLILRFRQLLFTAGRYRDLIDLTIDKDDLYNRPNRREWRNYWYYMGSLLEIGDEEAFKEASEWYWKVWDPQIGRDEKKISSLAISWLYALLALKNKAYSPAYHANFNVKSSISYQILLTIFIETQRLENAVDLLKDEVDYIKVIGTDIVRRLTASVKESGNEDLHNELIKVCGELDSKVRLEDKPLHEQVYDAMKGAEKRT